jgi:hypothetical protein
MKPNQPELFWAMIDSEILKPILPATDSDFAHRSGSRDCQAMYVDKYGI